MACNRLVRARWVRQRSTVAWASPSTIAAIALCTCACGTPHADATDGATSDAASTHVGNPATDLWKVPRTSDGHPDLRGVWISRSATPVERPKALEGRARLTDAEVAQLEERASRIFKTGNSDFAAGDAVFLAALENPTEFRSVTATHGAEEMIDREFDHRTSLVSEPSDGRIPPLTSSAEARRAGAAAANQRPSAPEDLTNALRCVSWGVPRLGGRYGAGDLAYYHIVQSRDHVALYFETGHEVRMVPLDGRPHLPSAITQWSGDSRGHWEGDTLVVDTTNFSERSRFMAAAERLHLVERFTRTSADTIRYEMSFDDATTWTRPWKADMPLKLVQASLFEYACHEGNEEIVKGILSAARADDRRASDSRAR